MTDPRTDAPPCPGPDQLTAIKAHRPSNWKDALAAVDWLVGEVEELLELLKRLEWARTGFCPTCSAARGSPHDPGCELAAMLYPGNTEDPPRSPGED